VHLQNIRGTAEPANKIYDDYDYALVQRFKNNKGFFEIYHCNEKYKKPCKQACMVFIFQFNDSSQI